MCGADVFLGFLAILFPPLPVWVKRGLCSADSLINILLCVLGYIPGLLHAWYVIARFPEEADGYYEGVPEHNESGRVTYVFVQPQAAGRDGRGQRLPQQQQQPQQQGGMNYGATAHTGGPAPATSSSAAAAQGNGEGGSNGHAPPPTYAEAVKGDFKVQTHD